MRSAEWATPLVLSTSAPPPAAAAAFVAAVLLSFLALAPSAFSAVAAFAAAAFSLPLRWRFSSAGERRSLRRGPEIEPRDGAR